MSLSSRAPLPQAARVSNGSAFSDALTSWNLPHLANSVISNSLVCGLAQATGLDSYFDAPAGSGVFQQAIYDGAYCALVNQTGGMLRLAVPTLRVW